MLHGLCGGIDCVLQMQCIHWLAETLQSRRWPGISVFNSRSLRSIVWKYVAEILQASVFLCRLHHSHRFLTTYKMQ